jgi:anti-sigma28 factor (negative regulator of flagellin synthesis)
MDHNAAAAYQLAQQALNAAQTAQQQVAALKNQIQNGSIQINSLSMYNASQQQVVPVTLTGIPSRFTFPN